MKKQLRLTFCAICICSGLQAQDPQFSQFYANQILLNPAFTGSGDGARVALNYRRQWSSIPGAYKTFAAGFDYPLAFGGTNHGLGLTLMSDQAGEGNLNKLDANITYAYDLEINKYSSIRFGLAGGIQQSSIDFYKLRFGDQIDPLEGFTRPTNEAGINQSRITPDVSAGALYFNKFVYVGATVNHLTQPKQRFFTGPLGSVNGSTPDTKLPMKISAFGGVNIPIGKNKSIAPAALFKTQGPFTQIDIGLYTNLDPLVIGLWYRNQDAVIALIGVRKGIFSFGYSYDYTISKLRNSVTGGSHEISLVLQFEQNKKHKKKHKSYPCPRF